MARRVRENRVATINALKYMGELSHIKTFSRSRSNPNTYAILTNDTNNKDRVIDTVHVYGGSPDDAAESVVDVIWTRDRRETGIAFDASQSSDREIIRGALRASFSTIWVTFFEFEGTECILTVHQMTQFGGHTMFVVWDAETRQPMLKTHLQDGWIKADGHPHPSFSTADTYEIKPLADGQLVVWYERGLFGCNLYRRDAIGFALPNRVINLRQVEVSSDGNSMLLLYGGRSDYIMHVIQREAGDEFTRVFLKGQDGNTESIQEFQTDVFGRFLPDRNEFVLLHVTVPVLSFYRLPTKTERTCRWIGTRYFDLGHGHRTVPFGDHAACMTVANNGRSILLHTSDCDYVIPVDGSRAMRRIYKVGLPTYPLKDTIESTALAGLVAGLSPMKIGSRLSVTTSPRFVYTDRLNQFLLKYQNGGDDKEFAGIVFLLMCIQATLTAKKELPELPKEMWVHIFTFVHAASWR